jgi:hypothetical protein
VTDRQRDTQRDAWGEVGFFLGFFVVLLFPVVAVAVSVVCCLHFETCSFYFLGF